MGGFPKMDGLYGKTIYKWMIWYLHFRKPPYSTVSMTSNMTTLAWGLEDGSGKLLGPCPLFASRPAPHK